MKVHNDGTLEFTHSPGKDEEARMQFLFCGELEKELSWALKKVSKVKTIEKGFRERIFNNNSKAIMRLTSGEEGKFFSRLLKKENSSFMGDFICGPS